MNKELQKLLLAQQEEQSYHLPMEAEYSFYRRIANGDMELLKLNMNAENEKGIFDFQYCDFSRIYFSWTGSVLLSIQRK